MTTDDGAPRPPQQRARQGNQAKRQHADPPRVIDLHGDVMAH